jgi:hypothetical protein
MYDLILPVFVFVQAVYLMYLTLLTIPKLEEDIEKLRTRVGYFHEHIDQATAYQKEYTDQILNEFSQQLNSVNQAWADEFEVRFQGLEYVLAELSKSAMSQPRVYAGLSHPAPAIEKIKEILQEPSGLRNRARNFSEVD